MDPEIKAKPTNLELFLLICRGPEPKDHEAVFGGMMNTRTQIEQFAHDNKGMTALASRCRIGSPEDAGRIYSEIAPAVIELMHTHARSPEGLSGLMTAARALTWTEREQPAGLFESGHPRIGEAVTSAIFGPSLEGVVKNVASAAQIAEVNAGVFVETTTTVVLASLAGHPEQDVRQEAFLQPAGSSPAASSNIVGGAAVATPAAAMPAAAMPAAAMAAATVAAVSGSTPTSPSTENAAAPVYRSKQTRSSDDEPEGGSRKGLILAGAAAVALLLGVGGLIALGGGNGDGSSNTDDEQVSNTLALEATDTTVAVDDSPTTTAEPVAAASTTSTIAEPVGDPDIITLSVPMNDIAGTVGDAEGVLSFDFNTATGEICYAIESINIDGPYRSHIHVGGADVKGGIVVDLGPQVSGAVGCVDNLAVDTNAILADPAGHYAELHDVTEDFTIRGQLSEANEAASIPDQSSVEVVDTDGGGASILLDSGVIYLVGDVPDQETADELADSLAGVDAATEVVNNLEVVDGAPLPSGRVVIADAVFFEVASSEVKSIDKQTLEAMTALANSRPDWVLTIVGHTDSAGSDVDNLELSLARASSLRDLLAEQGIADENLRVRGAGETAPIGDNKTDAGRAQNRRIEFEFSSPSE